MGSEDLRRPESVSERRHIRNTCNPRNVSNKTLGSVLNLDRKSSPENQPRRTLFDIIQADSTGDSKKTWRYFRNKLLLKRADAAWTSILRSEMQRADSINNSMNSRMVLRRPSTRIPTSDPDIDSPSGRTRSSSLQKSISNLSNEEPPEENEGTPASEKGEGEEGSGKMSLMALLAETDREMGLDGSAYTMDDEEEDDDGGENAESGAYNNCCVCMVRHKGAAFIPCGHTFCRLCSRELYVQREYCPLCNRYILEILDIY